MLVAKRCIMPTDEPRSQHSTRLLVQLAQLDNTFALGDHNLQTHLSFELNVNKVFTLPLCGRKQTPRSLQTLTCANIKTSTRHLNKNPSCSEDPIDECVRLALCIRNANKRLEAKKDDTCATKNAQTKAKN